MTPDQVCIDANVFVSALVKKEGCYAESLEVLRSVQKNGIALFEPEVVLFEFGTAIHRKRGAGEIDDQDTDSLMELFFRLPLLFIWESSLMQRASKLARQLSFQGMADGYYLAVAEKKKIPLVTLDQELMKKGKSILPSIYSPTEFIDSLARSESD